MSPPPVQPVPPPVARLLGALEAGGHEAFLVGPCVPALLEGRPVADFEITTSADVAAVLALFPLAVLTDAARGRTTVPTAAGPVDVVPYRDGGGLETELAQRDFTRHAIALSAAGDVVDPYAGRADADKTLLRSVGPASQCLAEDPLRALRAARLVATQDLALEPSLAAALPVAARALASVPAARLREELCLLLLGSRVARGLALLRDSGLQETLAPGAAADAPEVVAAVPADLELRLAAWLRGTRAVAILRRLRVPRPRTVAVERILQLHPIDAGAAARSPAQLRRLARRSGPLLAGLLALREAEIAAGAADAAARERLVRLREALSRTQEDGRPPELALDGRAVMEILGCGPGPHVGRALRHLTELVRAEPDSNAPQTLRSRLLAWWESGAHDGAS